MFFDYPILEDVRLALFGIGAVLFVGALFFIPLAIHFSRFMYDGTVTRPKYSGRKPARRLTMVESDLISGQPLGDHRTTLAVPLSVGVSAIVTVNAATVAGMRHRGIGTFLPGLRNMTETLERSGVSVFVRLAGGGARRIPPVEWYRLICGTKQLLEYRSAQSRLSRPASIHAFQPERDEPRSVPAVSAITDRPHRPEPVDGVLDDPSSWDIPLGTQDTPSYEGVSVTHPEEHPDDYYEEIIIEEW